MLFKKIISFVWLRSDNYLLVSHLLLLFFSSLLRCACVCVLWCFFFLLSQSLSISSHILRLFLSLGSVWFGWVLFTSYNLLCVAIWWVFCIVYLCVLRLNFFLCCSIPLLHCAHFTLIPFGNVGYFVYTSRYLDILSLLSVSVIVLSRARHRVHIEFWWMRSCNLYIYFFLCLFVHYIRFSLVFGLDRDSIHSVWMF